MEERFVEYVETLAETEKNDFNSPVKVLLCELRVLGKAEACIFSTTDKGDVLVEVSQFHESVILNLEGLIRLGKLAEQYQQELYEKEVSA